MIKTGVRLSGTNLERAAEHNQRTTLHAIRVHGSITRVALSHITGLTAPAIANIIKRLIEEELVVETGRLRKGRGQPGKVIEINPAARYSFGVNIDRDRISFVLVNFMGEVIARRNWEDAFSLPADVEHLWRTNAQQMLAESGVDPARLCGIGVAMPDDLGSIYIPGAPSTYTQWREVAVEKLFATPFDVPILVENDARAAALGEQQFGSGPEYSSILYLLISAGVGGALIINGQIVRGATGRSGEIGLIPLGNDVLLQDHVSLSSLARHLARAEKDLATVFSSDTDEGCEASVNAWIDEAVEALVPALTTINCIVNPSVVLIGSRLPASIVDRLAAATEQAIEKAYPDLPAHAPVRRAELSGSASVIGAAILPFIKLYLPTDNALWKAESD
ncbi:sugar kinase [Novosphingobium endophyticum]|uniref:Sugar kinase n=1 Tax=Novosphingobium endophyticum TaxID=1955250 RepID=A0A916X7D6_9SPHN|nr:ROK family transcriptional regulator [Novosphingobium endophyticum]GGC16633.1 sugar kinase [Novosphingobium endophyticum]